MQSLQRQSLMPKLLTAYFGELEYANDAVFRFPEGLPGFEHEQDFVFIRRPQTEPIIFMQSLATPGLCFLLLPVLVACADYRLRFAPEDLAALQLPGGSEPRIGEDILCGAIVSTGNPGGPTVNLLGPVVVNLRERVGIQTVQTEGGYSHQHPLFAAEARNLC